MHKVRNVIAVCSIINHNTVIYIAIQQLLSLRICSLVRLVENSSLTENILWNAIRVYNYKRNEEEIVSLRKTVGKISGDA